MHPPIPSSLSLHYFYGCKWKKGIHSLVFHTGLAIHWIHYCPTIGREYLNSITSRASASAPTCPLHRVRTKQHISREFYFPFLFLDWIELFHTPFFFGVVQQNNAIRACGRQTVQKVKPNVKREHLTYVLKPEQLSGSLPDKESSLLRVEHWVQQKAPKSSEVNKAANF